MDKKSIFLFSFVLIVIIVSGVFQYRTFVEKRNYVVTNYLSCDPEVETCFISDCSPETDEECDTEPYKKIAKLAKNIPACEDLTDCPETSCAMGEEKCMITWCSPDAVEEGELCTEKSVGEVEESEDMALTAETVGEAE